MFVAGRGRKSLVAAIVTVLVACSTTPPVSPKVNAAAVYDTIVRWFASAKSDDPDPLPVFIEPRGQGASIELDVQAGLVKSAKDVATVRFIDARDEALASNADGSVGVADGGILIRLAPVVEQGSAVRLDVDIFDHDDVFRTMQFDLARAGERWIVTKAPVNVPTG